jgi:hypothetical protein
MMHILPALALLLIAAPAASQPVDAGRADWDALPPLKARSRVLPTNELVGRVETILKSNACTLPGQRATRFDITVPFAILVAPDGTAERILVAEMNCAPLETLVGMIALKRVEVGDLQPTGERKARWFGSEITFTLQ